MRNAIVILALALVLPTATALPPFLELWEGRVATKLFVPSETLCHDVGDAIMLVERELEAATFTLHVEADCARDAVFRGMLTPRGWEFVDPAGAVSGGFYHTDDPLVGRLEALIDTCPPFVICEFTSGVRLSGSLRYVISVV